MRPLTLALLALALAPAVAGAGMNAAVNVDAIPAAGPYFALTFDAHAESQGARELLALLRIRGIRATLFVTGRFASLFPEILQQAVADGHEIGNHTFNHHHLTAWAESHAHTLRPGVTREFVQRELRATEVAITAATGRRPSRLWRAPYGEHNAAIRAWAAELGLTHVDWTRGAGTSLDSLDWVDDTASRRYLGAEAMARRLLDFERKSGVPLAGSIVLMHLGSGRPDLPLLEALPIFLDETDRRGLRPATVGELLGLGGLAAGPAAPAAIGLGSP